MKAKKASFFKLSHLLRLYFTIKDLKVAQVLYRLWYPIKRKIYPYLPQVNHLDKNNLQFIHSDWIHVYDNPHVHWEPASNTFNLLNKEKSFPIDSIDWKYNDNALLWLFHLHYFDWALASKVTKSDALSVLLNYIDNEDNSYIFTHSYPTSKRLINWVKLISIHQINNPKINRSIAGQVNRLLAFLEYDLSANHLLTNLIALVWVGIFFKNDQLLEKSKHLLIKELDDQFLEDGLHYEKSFSYHSEILLSLLELYAIAIHYTNDEFFINKLKNRIIKGLSILSVYYNSCYLYPNFNDANDEMSIPFDVLKQLASKLQIDVNFIDKKTLSFPILETKNGLKLIFNTGLIGALHQPGHAHADAFTFCLNLDNEPIIVDRGTSTYERNSLRLEERGTASHNTFCVEATNNAHIWAAFRMAQKNRIEKLNLDKQSLSYKQYGYDKLFNIVHTRTIFINECQSVLTVNDEIKGYKKQDLKLFFHFNHHIELIKVDENEFTINTKNKSMKLVINNAFAYIENYLLCIGFNKTIIAKRIVLIPNKSRISSSFQVL